MPVNFPTDKQRLVIVGATGTGKTVAAMWHLSRRNFDEKPWVIYDFKSDELIGQLENVNHISVADSVPSRPGIYVVHPHPGDTDAVEAQMWEIWKQGNTGVFLDEGYMVGRNNKAFRALLTQGRSKRVPMIILSQRPVWMDVFTFSEAEYFQVFRLQHSGDIKKMQEYIPKDLSARLPEFHSYYYDVPTDQLHISKPVPNEDAILDTFDARLERMKKVV